MFISFRIFILGSYCSNTVNLSLFCLLLPLPSYPCSLLNFRLTSSKFDKSECPKDRLTLPDYRTDNPMNLRKGWCCFPCCWKMENVSELPQSFSLFLCVSFFGVALPVDPFHDGDFRCDSAASQVMIAQGCHPVACWHAQSVQNLHRDVQSWSKFEVF